jgi:uncharacterized protein
MTTITFRPHHFMCALSFQGNGYSPAFVANFAAIMQQLNAPEGNAVEIAVVDHTDSICEPCPSRLGKACQTQEKITRLDNAHAQVLQISPGQTLTWGAAKQRIGDLMSLENFHQACEGCSWKSFGICEGVLTKFLQDHVASPALL